MKISFHHINLVSKNLEELNNFYKNILTLDSIPEQQFPRTEANQNKGYDGKIKFVTDGNIQLHLAEKDLTVAEKNKKHINPVEKGHMAFRTDDIGEFKTILNKNNIKFADYGTTFAKEWYQIFFYDPEGNIVEVHQFIDKN